MANCRFQEGDASDLSGLDDGAFDLVVSVFGAMFAPRPSDVAREMVRVAAPGGRIVMGNWIPNDPTLVAQILSISGRYTPPPPEGFVSPMTWGDKATVTQRFGAAGIPAACISFSRETWTFDFAGPASELLGTFRDHYGPTMNAYAAAEASGRADELHGQMQELFERCNTSSVASTTMIPATYLAYPCPCRRHRRRSALQERRGAGRRWRWAVAPTGGDPRGVVRGHRPRPRVSPPSTCSDPR